MSTNNSRKNQARQLQATTGMPYTRALRQVTDDHGGAPSTYTSESALAATVLALLGVENVDSPDVTTTWTAQPLSTNIIGQPEHSPLLCIPLGFAAVR